MIIMVWFDIIKRRLPFTPRFSGEGTFNIVAFDELLGDNARSIYYSVGNPPTDKLFKKIPWFADSFIISDLLSYYNAEEIVNNPEKLIEFAAVYDINLKDPSELNMLMTYLKSKGIEPVM